MAVQRLDKFLPAVRQARYAAHHFARRSGLLRSGLLHSGLLFSAIVQIFFFNLATARADEPTIEVRPQSGSTDDLFTVDVTVSGNSSSNMQRPELEPTPEFSVRGSGMNSQHTIVNGEYSYQVSFSYELQPREDLKAGSYPLGKIVFHIGGLTETKILPKVQIVGEGAQSNQAQNKDLGISFIQFASDLAPYEGEQFLYRWELASGKAIDQITPSPITFDGFWHEPLGDASEQVKNVGGSLTRVFEQKEALFATRSGKIDIPERSLNANVLIDTPLARGRTDIFGRVFGEIYGLQRQQILPRRFIAPALHIDVKPLPPAPFQLPSYVPVGHVSAEAEISAARARQGETLQFQVTLTGDANLRPLEIPSLPATFNQNFKAYSDKPVVTENAKGNIVNFTKVFTFSLIPLVAGEIDLPALEFMTFDPSRGVYVAARTKPLHVSIAADPSFKGSQQSAATVAASSSNDAGTPSQFGEYRYASASLHRPFRFSPTAFSALLLLPPLLFLAMLLARFSPAFASKYSQVRERSRAFQDLEAAVAEARSAVELEGAFRSYLSQRFGEAFQSWTTQGIRNFLLPRGVSEECVAEVSALYSIIEKEKFRPASDVAALAKLRQDVLVRCRAIESDLDGEKGAVTIPSLLFFFVICAVPLFTAIAAADEPSEQTLEQAAKAFREQHFEAAFTSLQEVHAAGVADSTVLFNAAVSALHAGHVGSAIAALRELLYFSPRDGDAKNLLQQARSIVRGTAAPFLGDLSTLSQFYTSIPLSIPEWQILFAVSYVLCWILVARRLRSRSRLGSLFLSSLLITTLALLPSRWGFADNNGQVQIDFSDPGVAVVVLTPDVSAYSDRSDKFPVLEKLPEGLELWGHLEGNWFVLPLGERNGYVPLKSVSVVYPPQ